MVTVLPAAAELGDTMMSGCALAEVACKQSTATTAIPATTDRITNRDVLPSALPRSVMTHLAFCPRSMALGAHV